MRKRFQRQQEKRITKKIGYYASLDSVYTSLIEKEIKSDIQILKNIEKVRDMIKELKEFTVNYISKQD